MDARTSCQICFEQPPRDDGEDLIRSLCGSKCPAVVCRDCLIAHIQVSLERAYGGMLPKVRCPICLTSMNKNQWKHHVGDDSTHVLSTYSELCDQACALTPPCCHKDGYTHLQDADALDGNPGEEEEEYSLMLLPSVKAKIPAFRAKCRAFCRHRISARALLEHISDAFGAEKDADVVQRTLRRIGDEERRATLLLSYLYLRPAIRTRCCDYAICFNCKRIGHHRVCDDDSAVDEESSLVQCRNCRAMLLKVEGCDSVTCLCGYSMDWRFEVTCRVLDQKKLLPVDLFNYELLYEWHEWHGRYKTVVDACADRVRMTLLLGKVRRMLRPHLRVYLWRWRHAKQLHHVLNQMESAHYDQERQIFWETYAANNAEVMAEVEKEMEDFLRIGLHRVEDKSESNPAQ